MSVGSGGRVSGRTVEVAIEGVMAVFRGRIRNTLDDHGISEPDPQPDGWYRVADFVEVLQAVESDAGENTVNKIGEATPKSVEWPSDPDGPAEALAALDEVYQANHRNATGSYELAAVEDGSARVEVDTPYPCSFDRGLVRGTAETYGASHARIREVDDRCRDDGDDTCVYEIDL